MMKRLLETTSTTSMGQFRFFRMIFGMYLAWHFAALIPYAGEIFSQEGILGASGLNPFYGKWPNPFFLWGSPWVVQVSLGLGVVSAVLLSCGKLWRSAALLMWFLHSCLYTANPLTANPSLGYVGMLLLLCAVVPRGEKYLPKMIPLCAWTLLAVGYSFSGVLKLGSPSWLDGSALAHLMDNPLARPGVVRNMMMGLPDIFLKTMTWGTLALEVMFVPLVLWKRTRFFAWLSMVFMHVGIMMTVDFVDLSMGMLMVHLFTYNSEWTGKIKNVMNKLKGFRLKRWSYQNAMFLMGVFVTGVLVSGCSTSSPHKGVFPFTLLEKSPSKRSLRPEGREVARLAVIASYDVRKDSAKYGETISQLRAGDVIAFYISHQEARRYLRKGKIQKLPYELFQYGHLSIIVPDPAKPLQPSRKLKLLQVAMKQTSNTQSSLDYLKDKSWVVYRPPENSIDLKRLYQFTQTSVSGAPSSEEGYDYWATLGLSNGNLKPQSLGDVRNRYTCTTLVVAALYYSGFEMHALHHRGVFDVLTPRQVTEAWGVVRESSKK